MTEGLENTGNTKITGSSNLFLCVAQRYRGSARRARGLNPLLKNLKIQEAVLNLFRDRLRPMLKLIGIRDMQSIAESRDSRCEIGAQYGRNIPACNDNIISQ